MSDYIDDVFGPTGLLAKRFTGYAPRQGQVDFARAVDHAIANGEHLVAECPTGTGKSIGYAVPASFHASQEKLRVIIVTANIALQEQLVRKDLPLLADILPWKFTYSLLKGRSNYLCVDKVENGSREPLHPADAMLNSEIEQWIRGTETGDKSELAFEPEPRLWGRYSVGSDDCHGKDCDFFEQCWANAARLQAAEADIVVTNYSLLFADMQVRDMTGDMVSILPRYDIVILDEGHKAVDIARDFFGAQVTEGAVKRAVGLVPAIERDGMDEVIEDFFEQLRNYRRSASYKARLRTPHAVKWDGIHQVLQDAESFYNHKWNELDQKIEWGVEPHERRALRKQQRKINQRCERTKEIREQIVEAMVLAKPARPEELRVHFLEEEGERIKLCASPVYVAERLQESLFSQTLSVTTTSATLASRGSFDFIIKDLGVEKPNTLIAASPFRWGDQALLVTPTGLPDPTKERAKHAALVTETCAKVIMEAGGRTLGLFTSRRGVDEAYRRAIHTGYRILRQGEMPRTRLIDEFRRDIKSVLLGTESFWAGVDVPGESLSCVFIDRLPFTPPDDPILDALQEHDKDCFKNISIPRAIIAFKQGFGRLIRSASDRGVVVCMDGRLTTKFYGNFFLQSLPPVSRSRDIADVGRFLRGEKLLDQPQPLSMGDGTVVGGSLVNW